MCGGMDEWGAVGGVGVGGTCVSEEKSKRERLLLNTQTQQHQSARFKFGLLNLCKAEMEHNKKGGILFCPVVIPLVGETQNHVKHNGKYLRSSFINQERL